jgi:membrane fusion protein (multidrug efflux system)
MSRTSRYQVAIADLPRVLIADADPKNAQWLDRCLGGRYNVAATVSGREALAALDTYGVQVLIVGRDLADMSGAELIADVRATDAERGTQGRVALFLADPDAAAGPTGEDDGIYYVLSRGVAPTDIQALVASAIARQKPPARAPMRTTADAARMQRILEVARRFAMQKDLRGAARVATAALIELGRADRAYCLFHDGDTGALWSEDDAHPEQESGNAALGLAGFAARTGTQVAAAGVRHDPRYHKAIDDPAGDGDEHLIAQPIAGPDGQVHAVLVAIREGGGAGFSAEERTFLESLAEQSGPLIHHLALHVETEALLDRPEEGIFRREAIDAQVSHRKQGDVIRISPSWIGWSYWMLVAVLVVGIVYLSVGTIDQYSAGQAVVRMTGRTEVTAKVAGPIAAVVVGPGQPVEAGQILARFYDAEETAAHDRARRTFEAQLRNRLLNPGDAATGQLVQSLREQVERTQAQLAQREVRAPHDGTISDLRVRPGQPLAPGEIILSLVSEETELHLVALLPGGDRPQLKPGQKLRLELVGYRYAYQDLTLDSVTSDVLSPTEARRLLGSHIADSMQIGGPVVLVRARLPGTTFEADGETYRYHDGMLGRAEVRVKSERILTTLIPGLKGL